MVGNLRVTEQRGPLSSAGLRRFWVGAGAALLAAALIGSAAPRVAAGDETGGVHQVSGAGKTIIEGGTGAPAYIPVTTVLAFHANGQSGAWKASTVVTGMYAGAPV